MDKSILTFKGVFMKKYDYVNIENLTIEELKNILEKETGYEFEKRLWVYEKEALSLKGVKKGDHIVVGFSRYRWGERTLSFSRENRSQGGLNGMSTNAGLRNVITWILKAEKYFGYKIPKNNQSN